MTFARKPYERKRTLHQPIPTHLRRSVAFSRADGAHEPEPKAEALRSEQYRRLVAALPCKVCGIAGHSQAAHPNTGKGAGTKTDDRQCFPLCAV